MKALFLFSTLLILPLSLGFAEPKKRSFGARAIAPTGISVNDSFLSLLKRAESKNTHVYVVLENGTSYSAYVKDVNERSLVLKNPSGKELYEVLLPMDELVAVEFRVKK